MWLFPLFSGSSGFGGLKRRGFSQGTNKPLRPAGTENTNGVGKQAGKVEDAFGLSNHENLCPPPWRSCGPHKSPKNQG